MTLFRSATLFHFGSYRCVIHAIRRVGFQFNISVGIRQRKTFDSKVIGVR